MGQPNKLQMLYREQSCLISSSHILVQCLLRNLILSVVNLLIFDLIRFVDTLSNFKEEKEKDNEINYSEISDLEKTELEEYEDKTGLESSEKSK